MSAAELMADLTLLGIRLEADGDRLRFYPRSAVTPDMAERLRAYKVELLTHLAEDRLPQEEVSRQSPPATTPKNSDHAVTDAPPLDVTNATAVWQAALERLAGDPLFPPEVLADLRPCSVRWGRDAPEECPGAEAERGGSGSAERPAPTY